MQTGDRVTLWNENEEVKGTVFKTERIMDSEWVVLDLEDKTRLRVLAKAVTIDEPTHSADSIQ